MTFGIVSFLLWSVLMAVTIVKMVTAAKRSRKLDLSQEKTASSTLPQIGQIAEKRLRKNGRRTSEPLAVNESWYPKATPRRAYLKII